MSQEVNKAFGLPSVPRDTMPSMFEILGWYTNERPKAELCCYNETHQVQSKITTGEVPQVLIKQAKTLENVSLVKSEYQKSSPKKRRAKSIVKSGIYEYKEACLKRSVSQQNCVTSLKPVQAQIVVPIMKKLDPNSVEDAMEIKERKKRIKKFQYVTRDLSNSAFTTYYGKPAWEVYGRCNSNPKLLSHNVMPHRGQNRPKDVQSYYSALIKGKKQSLSTYVPRKPIEEIIDVHRQQEVQPINLPTEVPDLINHVRFTAEASRKRRDDKIPTNKVAPLKLKGAKKQAKKEKKRKTSPDSKMKNDDGLKFMNTRENLLKILESKKTNGSKLAWKVTECYPFDLKDEEKLKQSTVEWDHTRPAGTESIKCDTIKDLMRLENIPSPLVS